MLSFRERFTVVTMTWLTVTGYLCQNWPRICSIFFPHSWRIIVCVTSATRPVPLVEQELLILPEHLCLPPVYSGVRIARTLIFVDRWLFFCPLRCLSFSEIRLLMANFKLFIWVTRVCHIRSGNFLGSLSFFCGVHVAHRFSFLCCGVFLCFVCLHPVSCVPNVASVSGFVFCDCSFSFLYVYLLLCKSENVYSGVRVYFMLTELCPLFTGYRVLIPLRHLSTMRPAHWKWEIKI